MALGIAGCGQYEPRTPSTPAGNAGAADAQNAYKECADAVVTVLDQFEERLARIKDAKSAEKATPAVRKHCDRMKAALAAAKAASQGLSPEDRRTIDQQYSPQILAGFTKMVAAAGRLAKTPGPTADLAQIVLDASKEVEPQVKVQPLPEPPPAPSGPPPAYAGPLLSSLLLIIFIACVGFLNTEGIWSNVIRLIDVILAALLAVNFFEPVAGWLTEKMPTFTSMWDFLALWGLFALFLTISREITDRLSRVNVRFLKVIDRVGGGALAIWIGWVMVCFALTTLHTAPLGKNFLFGAFQPGEKMFFGVMAPDLQWLAFTKKVSEGAYCREGTGQPDQPQHTFDPECIFLSKHSDRRAKLESYMSLTHALRVNPDMAAPGK